MVTIGFPVSAGSMIFGIVVSVVIALIYQFFVFAVDYTRTEYLQYEDDDYYYYVKAVPKSYVAQKEKSIKTISSDYDRKPEKEPDDDAIPVERVVNNCTEVTK